MIGEYTLLVPHALNDGTAIPADDLAALEARMLWTFGGFTNYGTVRGAWRDPSTHTVYRDSLTHYGIATDKEADVFAMAKSVARTFAQQAVYLRRPDGSVVFVTDGVAAQAA